MKKIKLTRKHIMFFAVIAVIIAIMSILFFSKFNADNPSSNEVISITDKELQQYRQNIGDNMDIKKTILIIFNTSEECQAFIDEHGNNNDPISVAGVGITPQMQEGYYNVVGNSMFETVFDSLQDGEYVKEPIEFGGAFCYFKRLENYSVVNSDEDLKEFIMQEKSMERGGEIDEENN